MRSHAATSGFQGRGRGNLNSLADSAREIAALPAIARNDNQRDFINTPLAVSSCEADVETRPSTELWAALRARGFDLDLEDGIYKTVRIMLTVNKISMDVFS